MTLANGWMLRINRREGEELIGQRLHMVTRSQVSKEGSLKRVTLWTTNPLVTGSCIGLYQFFLRLNVTITGGIKVFPS